MYICISKNEKRKIMKTQNLKIQLLIMLELITLNYLLLKRFFIKNIQSILFFIMGVIVSTYIIYAFILIAQFQSLNNL